MTGPGAYTTDPMPRDVLCDQIRVLPVDMQLALIQASQTLPAAGPSIPIPAPQPAPPASRNSGGLSWWAEFTPMPGSMM